ncbi:hypothetical protein [Salinibacterium sp. PAMC 21357]|uniref:hypothetical protein n=1 Tax=Salinibacterium sp. PAMC 21357 TaxID=1112215 RepID=UPI000289786F|nr:hypothetical protein [Salinibacterium sp. PAMC 21357]
MVITQSRTSVASRLRKAIAASALTFAVLAAAGCAAAAPAESEPQDAPETEACAKLADEQLQWLSDAIPGEMMSDSFGNYCKLRIDPDSDALVYDASTTDLVSLKEFGFTEEDAATAQIAAITYLVEQTLDSEALDNPEVNAVDWKSGHSELFDEDGPVFDAEAFNNLSVVSEKMAAPLNRDGRPRARSIDVQVNKIWAALNDGVPYLIVQTAPTATYEADDALLIATMLANDPDRTEASVEAEAPYLFDGEDTSGVSITGVFNFGFTSANPSLISGIGATWNIFTLQGTDLE